MADYKRIVSYIYQYNHQVKGNNTGFTRLETRNGQCKIIVHVRVPNLQNIDVKVYAYCWYDNAIHGIALGNMSISGGMGEFKLLTEADNLCNTGYHLSDMGGILVYISDTNFLGTEWDDRPIRFDMLQIDTEKPSDFSQRRNLRGEAVLEAAGHGSQAKREEGAREAQEKVHVEESRESGQKVHVEESSESDRIEEANLELAMVSSKQEDREPSPVKVEAASLEMETHLVDSSPVTDLSLATGLKESEDSRQENTVISLSKHKLEQIDRKARAVFSSMLESESPPTKRSVEEKQTVEPVKVDPKLAIAYFTDFKSCESEEEYLEVLQEIKNLQTRIRMMENVCKEWKIKEARRKEQEQARVEVELEKKQLEDKLRKGFHINGAEEIYDHREAPDMWNLQAAVVGKQAEDATPEQKECLQEREPLEVEEAVDNDEEIMDDGHSGQIHPVVQRILSKYPTIEPFLDLEEGRCVRIEPQDIGIFPMENWILANNSFLLHGYYSYRHLTFFCKMVNGKPVYLLGVPGVNYGRERFMANMFGFSMFQPLTKVEVDGVQAANNSMKGNPTYNEDLGGEFGYWCMQIVF